MKIKGPNYSQFINQIYKNNNNQFEKKKKPEKTFDSIELSMTSKDIKKYRKKGYTIPMALYLAIGSFMSLLIKI
jgi:hypothetical protein